MALIIMGGATFLGVIANATEIMLLRRDAQTRVRKLNMVLGVFFSEVGFRALSLFSDHSKNIETLRGCLHIQSNWTDEDFLAARNIIKSMPICVDVAQFDLTVLSVFFADKRAFLMGLLENPALVEKEDFSETLIALFHLADELASRGDLDGLPPSDRNHLEGDINRAYKGLLEQWLLYLKRLKIQYPFLFSLAIRKNPFDPNASPIVRE